MSKGEALISADELILIGWQTYGWGWQTRLAREIGVSPRTMRRAAVSGVTTPEMAGAIRSACQVALAAATEDEYAEGVIAAVQQARLARGGDFTLSLLRRIVDGLTVDGDTLR